MRLIKFIVMALLMAAVVVLSLANRGTVKLNLLPDDIASVLPYSVDLPLFVVILASIFFGLVLGYVFEWVREHKHRRFAWQKGREAARLQREVKSLKKKHMSEADEVLAILEDAPSRG